MASTADALHRTVKSVFLSLTGWGDTGYECESHTQSSRRLWDLNNVVSRISCLDTSKHRNIVLRPGLRSGPTLGSLYSAPQVPLLCCNPVI